MHPPMTLTRMDTSIALTRMAPPSAIRLPHRHRALGRQGEEGDLSIYNNIPLTTLTIARACSKVTQKTAPLRALVQLCAVAANESCLLQQALRKRAWRHYEDQGLAEHSIDAKRPKASLQDAHRKQHSFLKLCWIPLGNFHQNAN